MNDAWYYQQQGAARGPVPYHHLADLARAGALGPADFVWQEGQPEWISAAAAGLFQPLADPQPPPILAATPSTSRSGTQGTAGRFQRPTGEHALKWPLIVAGSGMALLALAIFGWIANALLNPPAADRTVAAASADSASANADEPQPLPRVENPTLPSAPSVPPAAPVPAITAPAPSTTEPAPVTTPPAATPPDATTPPAATPATADPATDLSPMPAALPPETTPAPMTDAGASQQSQTLYQELDIRRSPKFTILGQVTIQDLNYQMLSELKASPPDTAGSRTVEQYVLDTKLLKADDLSQPMFEQSLVALRGWWFKYKLSKGGEIVEWKAGPPDGRQAAKIEPAGGTGFLMTSVMDEDGWKEMAKLSFLVPDDATRGKQPWVRQMSHDFGPLGSWYGETKFQRQGTNEGLLRVDYTHNMTYTPPAKDEPVGGGLPFVITAAEFRPEVAGGSFYFDTEAGRVQRVQERFLVKGAIQTELVGQAVTVEVEEDQSITLRILAENPWKE